MAFADAGCVLRVDMRCENCKYKILEILSSVVGLYNVNINGEKGLVMIAGEVDPNMLLKALATRGRHAELVSANFKHPNWKSDDHGWHSYGSLGYPFSRCLPAYDHSYTPFFSSDYPFRRTSYGCGLHRRRPLAGHSPPYPRGGHGPYDDYCCNNCSYCN